MKPFALAVLSLLSCGSPSPREAASQQTPGAASLPGRQSGDQAIAPDLAKIDDRTIWSVINGESAVGAEGDRRVVRLSPKGGNTKGSNVGLALVKGLEFDEGAIELDLKGQGKEQRSFVGVAFGAADGATFEAVYFRPFNFETDDPERRGHAVQYVAWPEHTWEKLRTQAPGAYESRVAPVPDPAGWFHARVEVAKKQVRVFVNHADKPCLVVERLGRAAKGGVGLWVDSQEGSFANLRVLPATSGGPALLFVPERPASSTASWRFFATRRPRPRPGRVTLSGHESGRGREGSVAAANGSAAAVRAERRRVARGGREGTRRLPRRAHEGPRVGRRGR